MNVTAGQVLNGSALLTANGILPERVIQAMFAAGEISADAPPVTGQIQPASLDLRLGKEAYRVRASFLPGPDIQVAARLEQMKLHTVDLSEGAVLETGCVYIVPLQESLALAPDISATANPKARPVAWTSSRVSSQTTVLPSTPFRPATPVRFMPKSRR